MKNKINIAQRWVIAAVVAGVLSTALVVDSAPASAVEPGTDLTMSNSALAGEALLAVSGTLLVSEFDKTDGTSSTLFSVLTEGGQSIDVSGEFPAGVVTGSTFEGTVALPDSVLADATQAQKRSLGAPGEALGADTVAGQSVMSLVTAGAAPLEIAEAQFTLPVLGAVTPLAHTLDIAVVNGVSFSDSEISSLVSGMNTFWVGQSNGAVTSVTQSGTTRRFTTSTADNCTNFGGVWTNAASQFGHTPTYYTNGGGQHLLVITGADCGTGIGTVGASVGEGGLIWANIDDNVDLHTSAHEFGHNLGLGHSDLHKCANVNLAEGTSAQGCSDYEYYDFVDVMGGGITGTTNTNKLSALNIVHKVELGFIPTGDVTTVTSNTSVVLKPISDASGVRGIIVPTPGGDSYMLEYRSGTGMDSGNLYTNASLTINVGGENVGMGPGVRVMKQRDAEAGYPVNSGDSVAIVQPKFGSETVRRSVMQAGATFLTEGGVVITVDAISSTQATVSFHSATVQQTYGADRYATAVALSQQGYPSGANVVYVAQGADFPDALGAAPAAASQGAPLLLTKATSLPDSVIAEINRLNPTNIVVVGGTGVVSPAVFTQLQGLVDNPANVIRLAGADRYATARAIVRYAYINEFVPLPSTAYIATGANYPDALSAAAAGGAIGAPVVLVNGAAGSLDAATIQLLDDLGVSKTRIAGGTGSVSNGIQTALQGFTTVTRYAGADRFQTSQLLNAAAFPSGTDQVFIATGYQFPDALAGASLAGAVGAPLYVVRTTCIPAQSKTDIVAGTPDLITLVGGPGVLGTPVKQLISC